MLFPAHHSSSSLARHTPVSEETSLSTGTASNSRVVSAAKALTFVDAAIKQEPKHCSNNWGCHWGSFNPNRCHVYLKKVRQQFMVPDIEKHYTAYRILEESNTWEALTGSRCKRYSTITRPSFSLFLKKHSYRLNSLYLQQDWVSDHHVDLFKFLNTVIAIKSSYCIILSYFK